MRIFTEQVIVDKRTFPLKCQWIRGRVFMGVSAAMTSFSIASAWGDTIEECKENIKIEIRKVFEEYRLNRPILFFVINKSFPEKKPLHDLNPPLRL